MKKVIVLSGVTGAGKSELSLYLAQDPRFEIINADSVNFYRKMNIGSAKLDLPDHHPYHLHDFLELHEKYSIADYQKDARQKMKEIHTKNKIPILVGGSGLYINAVIYDYRFPQKKLREIDESLTNEELKQYLDHYDPEASQKIHINNRQRLIRAVRMHKTYQKTQKEIHGGGKDRLLYQPLVLFLDLPKKQLDIKLKERLQKMFEEGLVAELDKLFKEDPKFFQYTSTRAIGYQEFSGYFLGNKSIEQVFKDILDNTKDLAKRQKTWFRNQNEVIVINDSENREQIVKEIIEEFIKKSTSSL